MIVRTFASHEHGTTEVVAKIEDMITLLKKEDADELKKKETARSQVSITLESDLGDSQLVLWLAGDRRF